MTCDACVGTCTIASASTCHSTTHVQIYMNLGPAAFLLDACYAHVAARGDDVVDFSICDTHSRCLFILPGMRAGSTVCAFAFVYIHAQNTSSHIHGIIVFDSVF